MKGDIIMKKIKAFIDKYILTTIKSIDWTNISAATYVRYILMIVAALNSILNMLGCNPIHVDENQLYDVISNLLTVLILFVNTYKNNSITGAAIEGDKVMKQLKADAKNETSEEKTETDTEDVEE